jgi:hypothetical protein
MTQVKNTDAWSRFDPTIAAFLWYLQAATPEGQEQLFTQNGKDLISSSDPDVFRDNYLVNGLTLLLHHRMPPKETPEWYKLYASSHMGYLQVMQWERMLRYFLKHAHELGAKNLIAQENIDASWVADLDKLLDLISCANTTINVDRHKERVDALRTSLMKRFPLDGRKTLPRDLITLSIMTYEMMHGTGEQTGMDSEVEESEEGDSDDSGPPGVLSDAALKRHQESVQRTEVQKELDDLLNKGTGEGDKKKKKRSRKQKDGSQEEGSDKEDPTQ